MAGALALASHRLYGTFDLVARHCCGHHLRRSTTLGIAMTSYAFTLNLGSLVGGVGVRYRLYARARGGCGHHRPGGGHQRVDQLGGLPAAGCRAALAVGTAAAGRLECTRMAMAPGRRLAGLHSTGLRCAVCAARGRALTLQGHAFALPRWPVACGKWLRRPTTGC